MSGSVTVLDNTAGGTAVLDSSGVAVTVNRPSGYAFTTDTGSTWELRGITLALGAGFSQTADLSLRLYGASGGRPVGAPLASVSFSLSLGTVPMYFALDQAALGDLASYSMDGATGYVLALHVINGEPSWIHTTSGAATPPTATAGFAYDNFVAGIDGGAVWNTSTTVNPGFLMQAEATCFLRGTLILTARGEMPVERLKAGDLVTTKFGGLRAIRWIGTQSFHPRFAGRTGTPIRLAAGSLGHGVPSTDLFVSPGHAMLVGTVLAHAGALVNGSTITQPAFRGESIDYFHLDLGPHDCVLANGAWAESYFEDRNRDSFHNAADFHARFPGHVAERQATCLPIIAAGHPAAAGLQRRLTPVALRRVA